MFGFGIGEIVLVLVVAVIILGPDKLPNAIIEVVKFFRVIKRSVSDARDSLEREINLSEIKKEALEYKEKLEGEMNKVGDELGSVKNIEQDIKENVDSVQNLFSDYKPKPVIEDPKDESKNAKNDIASNEDSKKDAGIAATSPKA